MYKIDSFTLKQYVEDDWIKMPRFQRAKTWITKQKFELCLSIFKHYPLGCVILCSEQDKDSGTSTRWLIDGRQRYTTVKEMYKSPDIIYDWAAKYLGIKSSWNQQDIENKFWEKVSEFTNYDPNDKSDDEPDSDNVDLVTEEDNETPDPSLVESGKSEANAKDSNLSNLLDLITFCHNFKNGKNSGLSQVFDLSQYVQKNNRLLRKLYDEGAERLSCEKIKTFIGQYKTDCQNQKIDYKDKNNYLQYLDDTFGFADSAAKAKYLNEVLNSWEDKQLKAISFFECIDSILSNTFLAVISVEGANSTDEEKIFNLINTNGTPLTAAEILSAKPSWNKPLDYVSARVQSSIEKLYNDELDISVNLDHCVRWDLPACLPTNLTNFHLFFPFDEYGKDKKGKKITLGFKLMSGIYQNGIKKEDLDKLSLSKYINGEDFDSFLSKFNSMLQVITDVSYFKTLSTWKLSLSKLIGDAPTLSFLFLAYKMYDIEELPKPGSASYNIFKKNLFIIVDKLIYEYVNSLWKGSGDSLVASKIKEFTYSKGKLLDPLPREKWTSLIDSILDNNQIGGKDISFSVVKPIVAHYYGIKGLRCDVTYEFTSDFDHIIPQKAFKSSSMANKELLRDNIYNLGLLPKIKNASKNDKTLLEISGDQTLVDDVVKYEEINFADFASLTSPADMEKLKTIRAPKFKDAFGDLRDKILTNS